MRKTIARRLTESKQQVPHIYLTVDIRLDALLKLRGELNAILAFVEQLSEVNVEGVEPIASVLPMQMKKRADIVNDGGIVEDILANAPVREDNYFVVPKVVE